jgi:hypothetical protein
MPVGPGMWGGSISKYQVPVPHVPYPRGHGMSGPMSDQAQFFGGGPMPFRMRDQWSENFGSYGTYGRRRLNPRAAEFIPRW